VDERAAGQAAASAEVSEAEPFKVWYEDYRSHLSLRTDLPADEIKFSLNLVRWLGEEKSEYWQFMQHAVDEAFEPPSRALRLALLPSCRDQAREFHVQALQLDDEEGSVALFRRAALCDPSNADYINHLSVAAARAKRWETAERHARLALAIDPQFLNSYQELAYILKNRGLYEEVLAIAERGLKVDGALRTKALLEARKGQAYWMMGREPEAIAAFKRSKRIGGPQWVQSYLDGEQVLGERWRDPGTP
jgi:tetratricopeptide (TPR) repeat protein